VYHFSASEKGKGQYLTKKYRRCMHLDGMKSIEELYLVELKD
jgi:hypothetical protein